MVDNRQLQRSYTFLAPLYDRFVGPAMRESRRRSIEGLRLQGGERVLLSGVGTGLDLGGLPEGVLAVGVDLTPAMLSAARRRARRQGRSVVLVLGDAQRLPFRAGCFDAAILHLILAVVPQARAGFSEATRVVRGGGQLAVLDKFLRPGKTASLLRRLADKLTRPLVTGLNTRFEELLEGTPDVSVEGEAPDLLGGVFRRIRLRKAGPR